MKKLSYFLIVAAVWFPAHAGALRGALEGLGQGLGDLGDQMMQSGMEEDRLRLQHELELDRARKLHEMELAREKQRLQYEAMQRQQAEQEAYALHLEKKRLAEERQRLNAEQSALEIKKVDAAHPGWRQVVKSTQFTAWLDTQTPSVKALTKSPLANDAILILDKYKKDTSVSKKR